MRHMLADDSKWHYIADSRRCDTWWQTAARVTLNDRQLQMWHFVADDSKSLPDWQTAARFTLTGRQLQEWHLIVYIRICDTWQTTASHFLKYSSKCDNGRQQQMYTWWRTAFRVTLNDKQQQMWHQMAVNVTHGGRQQQMWHLVADSCEADI